MTDSSAPTQMELVERLARESLHLWDLPEGASARLINLSENATFLAEAPDGRRIVLRVHREGYHSRRAIECELAWQNALAEAGAVATARCVPGRDGARVQSARIDGLDAPRHMVAFGFLEGETPQDGADMAGRFEELGRIAARCHDHALSWRRPEGFERLVWDERAVFGPSPTWGDWRDAPGVDSRVAPVLERTEAAVRARLEAFGKAPDRFNLIHADMRLANLLVRDGRTQIIDFDDCGLGWLMYDFAAAVSFIEDDPRLPELRSAWVRGYRSVRPLPQEDEAEIGTFVMLRRMALLAWIGSHMEAPEPQSLAPDFAARTALLAQGYLGGGTAVQTPVPPQGAAQNHSHADRGARGRGAGCTTISTMRP